MNELSAWRDEATRIAEEAGRLLMGGWRGDARVSKKGRIDLVTDYDLKSEALLRERMGAAFPQHTLVAEEGQDRAEGEWIWYVDPLDGTTNFAHGHFFFAVSIGLAHRGKPVLGVVHAPALGVTWAGADGLGATRAGAPCRTSTAASLEDAVVGTGFPYDRGTSEENNLREASHIIPKVRGIRRCGAAALDVCLVADGTYDGYWEQKVSPWDVCAGLAIALAAGAKVSDYEGNDADARTSRLVVTNGPLHPALLGAVQRARG
ncbi:MAG: inositol monophosphatase family protein [Sandaracinaceae bacterium]